VRDHNTILLANHGIVCWADTVTHAEWYAEVLDTYCWTLMVAKQIGKPLTHIPPDKVRELLELKKRLGLPDARHGKRECELSHIPADAADQVDEIVRRVTDAVLAALSVR